MFFTESEIQVWRYTASGAWADPTWAYSHVISGVIQPFTGDDSYKMGQDFENVRDLVTCTVNEDVLKQDMLYYRSAFHRIQYIHIYDTGILPHDEIYTTDSQWEPS